MAKKKSSMDPGMEDDGTYPSDDISVYSDEDTESPGDYGAAPTKTMRKSAAGRSLKRWSRKLTCHPWSPISPKDMNHECADTV